MPLNRVFDAAKWCTDDLILCAKENYNILLTERNIDDIIFRLTNTFDENKGVNWGVIEESIEFVMKDYRWI